jgi:hypothetical protein
MLIIEHIFFFTILLERIKEMLGIKKGPHVGAFQCIYQSISS